MPTPTPPVWWPAVVPYPPSATEAHSHADVEILHAHLAAARDAIQRCVDSDKSAATPGAVDPNNPQPAGPIGPPGPVAPNGKIPNDELYRWGAVRGGITGYLSQDASDWGADSAITEGNALLDELFRWRENLDKWGIVNVPPRSDFAPGGPYAKVADDPGFQSLDKLTKDIEKVAAKAAKAASGALPYGLLILAAYVWLTGDGPGQMAARALRPSRPARAARAPRRPRVTWTHPY